MDLFRTVTGIALSAALAATASHGAFAQERPGEGTTVRYARNDSLGANYVQDQIIIAALEELGYDVDLTTLGTTVFLQAAAQGDLDISGDLNMPQTAASYSQVEQDVALVGDGSIIGGGTNGYVIDKATAEKYDITSLEQLKDPEIASLFDIDGDGKAELVTCDPGWRCGDVVDYQIEEFGLGDTVRTLRAKYEVLLAETFSRFDQGQPVLFYMWQPSWVADRLQPGRDTVWLPIPFDALPEGVTARNGHLVEGVVGCAGGQDPCRMATGSWNWEIAANREFLKENPAVQKLGETVEWPLATWVEWERSINEDSSDRNMERLAESWIEDNRSQFDSWVEEAASVVPAQ